MSQARKRLADALGRVASGSESALAEVYEHTAAKLFGICLRILGNRSDAEDALQEVYINVWSKAGSFDAQRASPITWLATMARNRAIDRLRSSGGRTYEPVEEALEVADTRPAADALIEQSQGSARLSACIDQLDSRQSDAIRTAFFQGVTYAQLATRKGVPLATMKSWVRRGLLTLRECLGR
jgi:RNA polymerase sigma-70 factor (ECF subfamily)